MRRPQKTCAICECGRPGRRLQGRAHPVPVPDRARQDPAEPALGHLRPAPAPAQHRHQARAAAGAAALHQGLRRLSPTRAGRMGHRRWPLAGAVLLLAPPVFVFGPLAGLLLLSRPATAREWLWLVGARCWSTLWLQQVGGLGAQVTRAARGAVVRRVPGADALAPFERGGARRSWPPPPPAPCWWCWMWRLGIGWSQLVSRGGSRPESSTRPRYGGPVAERRRAAGAHRPDLGDGAFRVPVVPGTAGAGRRRGTRGWPGAWYHRLASRPLGRAAGAVPELRVQRPAGVGVGRRAGD